jgi:hypothetical protein
MVMRWQTRAERSEERDEAEGRGRTEESVASHHEMMAAACGAVKHAASTPLSSITILAAPAIIVEATS